MPLYVLGVIVVSLIQIYIYGKVMELIWQRLRMKRKKFPLKTVAFFILLTGVILFSVWYFGNATQPTGYVELTIRDSSYQQNDTVIEFGDTEYSFRYYSILYSRELIVNAPFQSKSIFFPREGETYKEFGLEIKVSKVGSDYISDYIVILVRPIVQNYMASLHYTRVDIKSGETKVVNISSGLINKTNQYSFTYTQGKLLIQFGSQRKELQLHTSFAWDTKDFEIEVKVYKVEPDRIVIYVKPLY